MAELPYARRLRVRTACVACCVVAVIVGGRAERLPTRTYGVVDGLPSTFIEHVTTDRRGLLWLSTREGLARFDGTRFVTYGVEHGLSAPSVSMLLQTSRGEYWVATNGGGVCKMDADGHSSPSPRERTRPLFACSSPGPGFQELVNVLYEDPAGRLYAGTDGGLFQFEEGSAGLTFHLVPLAELTSASVTSVLAVDGDELWVGTSRGLARVRRSGPVVHRLPVKYGGDSKDPSIRDLLRDPAGRVWIAYRHGILSVRPTPSRELRHVSDLSDTVPGSDPRWLEFPDDAGSTALTLSFDGRLWVGVKGGVIEIVGGRIRRYGTQHGLSGGVVMAIAEDHDRNLWVASQSGLTKLSREGFISYDEADGFPRRQVRALYEDHTGRVLAVGGDGVLSVFDGERFASARFGPPRSAPWMAQPLLLDRHGDWWILQDGVTRVSSGGSILNSSRAAVTTSYTAADGLTTMTPFRAFEDARGDVWIGGRAAPGGVTRWDRGSGQLQPYPDAQGETPGDQASAFCDADGGLWIGFSSGGLIRYRHGRFMPLVGTDVPRGMIGAIHRDARGRLWIGSNRDGLSRVDDPAAEHPRFVRYLPETGLSSSNVRALTSLPDGTLVVGTARGVYHLAPDQGVLRHYTTADGLSGDFVTSVLHDRAGRLWVGTLDGLSRLESTSPRASGPPPVWIDGLRVGGLSRPISHLGETAILGVEIGPGRNPVQIDFYTVGFRPGLAHRYEYRLNADPWTAAAAERTVHYARLAPGAYAFEVRAVTGEGVGSPMPARVEIVVHPHLTQRWSFRTAVLLVAASLLFAAHRYRVRRLIESERVRTRIASDLHDDIGSTLSQIAILSEVARRQGGEDPRFLPLQRIARLSRECVDAMADIVWAVDPHRDTLEHLVKRMRRLASDLLGASGIELQFTARDSGTMRLAADVRREVFLVFKEAVHNIVRHADAARVWISLDIGRRTLRLVVTDDGAGFRVDTGADGQGLRNMRRRTRSLAGTLEIDSQVGRGTTVRLTVPLAGPLPGSTSLPT